ncbi:hypothetical protein [Microbulbifer rhizosphaerae]|uniref:Uncharacterized protein n=1 Tax=Microbulbifer rhizosphaerae TaxID=1562603 RepID=A0A7W4WGD9_9GAMM|nr:hypothetical protein [Microbulbifer rhizosphaerae]MBB3063720.1 hypothetical protein [Microbulbifer rhizosphaerae]
MNHEENLKIIEGFIGKECERTLACNSLKIRFGEKSPYIWIDPPWDLYSGEELVASSLSYPEADEDFQSYSNTLSPLDKTKLVSFEYTVKNGLVLHFKNGFRLHAPTTIDTVDEDDFYHHWYANA